ncbi:MAG: hypothetical protein JW776_09125 [Candidatus Lokiarchaeota archaeon]|nr:hypothetical protein [Candidatus Lokiarchaeota archaeon]
MMSLAPVYALYDDFATGKSYEQRIYGPAEILVPYIEHLGQGIDPQFAVGPTGTVSIVYSDIDDHDVYYMDNASGTWSTPYKLMDSQYINFEEHDITTDGNGNVYIIADGAVRKFFTNRSGSWVDVSLPLDDFYYNIKTNDAGDQVYIVTTILDTGPTPADHEIQYINITYTGPTTYGHNSQSFDFPEGEPYNPISFLDMDINSTGHVHCIYRGFAEIYYFVINPDGTQTTPSAISQTNGEILSHCNWPSMDIDSNDEVHVIYTKSNYDAQNRTIKSTSGLYYDIINQTTDGSSAAKISNYPGGRAYIITDENTRYIGSYQSIDEITQLEYVTDSEGYWNDTILTNFSYSLYVQGMSVRDIEINPVTNEPIMLTRYRGHMELFSMQGGKWGTSIEFKAELSSLEVTYPENLQLTMEITNLDENSRDFATFAQVFGLAEIVFENTAGNKQAVSELDGDEKLTLNWEMHYTGAYNGQLHASLLVNADIDDRGYTGVYWSVLVRTNIPGYSIWVIGLISILAISLTVVKHKK